HRLRRLCFRRKQKELFLMRLVFALRIQTFSMAL
ncbi:MAG: hypothetical protein ACI8YC_001026, partial [Salibacteraceae bacterium]